MITYCLRWPNGGQVFVKRRSNICQTVKHSLHVGRILVKGGQTAAEGRPGRPGGLARPVCAECATTAPVSAKLRSTLRSNPCGRFFGPIRAVDSSVQSVWGLGPNPAGRPAPPPVLVKIRRILCVCGARVKGRERENRRTDRH